MKSSIIDINTITSVDAQLTKISIGLTNYIIYLKKYYPEKFNDKDLKEIFNIAQKWNKVFNDFYCSKEGAKS